ANAVIILFLGGERPYATQNGMVRRARLRLSPPRLNGGVPVVRRAAGFVIEMTAHPLGDLIVDAHRSNRAPMKEYKPAAALHLSLDDPKTISDIERLVLFLPIRAVRGKENGIGIVECRRIGGPAVKMRLDTHLALQIG